MATWRTLILREMEKYKDSFDNLVSFAIGPPWDDEYYDDFLQEGPVPTFTNESFLDEDFNEGLGGIRGRRFTVWTKDRVYFPIVYDGAESCRSVSRNPDGLPTEHIGR